MHAAGEWGQRKKKLLENAGPLKMAESCVTSCYVMNYNW